MGSLYFTFTAIGTPLGIIGFVPDKIIISCLVTSIGSTFMDILIP